MAVRSCVRRGVFLSTRLELYLRDRRLLDCRIAVVPVKAPAFVSVAKCGSQSRRPFYRGKAALHPGQRKFLIQGQIRRVSYTRPFGSVAPLRRLAEGEYHNFFHCPFFNTSNEVLECVLPLS